MQCKAYNSSKHDSNHLPTSYSNMNKGTCFFIFAEPTSTTTHITPVVRFASFHKLTKSPTDICCNLKAYPCTLHGNENTYNWRKVGIHTHTHLKDCTLTRLKIRSFLARVSLHNIGTPGLRGYGRDPLASKHRRKLEFLLQSVLHFRSTARCVLGPVASFWCSCNSYIHVYHHPFS